MQILVLKYVLKAHIMTVIVIILIHGMIATVISVELMIPCFMQVMMMTLTDMNVKSQVILLVMEVDVIPVVMAYQLLMEIALEMEQFGVLLQMPPVEMIL